MPQTRPCHHGPQIPQNLPHHSLPHLPKYLPLRQRKQLPQHMPPGPRMASRTRPCHHRPRILQHRLPQHPPKRQPQHLPQHAPQHLPRRPSSGDCSPLLCLMLRASQSRRSMTPSDRALRPVCQAWCPAWCRSSVWQPSGGCRRSACSPHPSLCSMRSSSLVMSPKGSIPPPSKEPAAASKQVSTMRLSQPVWATSVCQASLSGLRRLRLWSSPQLARRRGKMKMKWRVPQAQH
mmetsp:Transcript_4598/g.13418  ORF Transcript_4598/g.13418 Transcript_4598/m.13418 type:complete len:234 (-) Transcript_4598:454-1155(-)